MCRWYAIQQGEIPFNNLVVGAQNLVQSWPHLYILTASHTKESSQSSLQVSYLTVTVLQSLLCDRKLVKPHTFLTAEDTNLQATEMEPSRIDRLPLASGEDVRCWSMIHRTSVCGSVRVTSLC